MALVMLSAALGAAAEDGQSRQQVPMMHVSACPLTRRSSTCHTPPSNISRPVIVEQEHGTRCSALMVQFSDRLSAHHLARPASWGWLDRALKQFCEVRI
jgi:hypothetical protein